MASGSGLETAAIGLLTRAVGLDGEKRFTEAFVCYQEGLKLLIEVMKGTRDERKKKHLLQKVNEYMERAEKLKKHMDREKATGKYHEQIQIQDNSVGFSYNKLLGPYLDEELTEVEVEDPYVRNHHQVTNFLRLCELLVKSRCPVNKITLTTGSGEGMTNLQTIKQSLQRHGVQLMINVSQTLHDREIRLNNGWIVKIGRGLDYFKPSQHEFCIGHTDYDLRPCRQTTVDIFFKAPAPS